MVLWVLLSCGSVFVGPFCLCFGCVLFYIHLGAFWLGSKLGRCLGPLGFELGFCFGFCCFSWHLAFVYFGLAIVLFILLIYVSFLKTNNFFIFAEHKGKSYRAPSLQRTCQLRWCNYEYISLGNKSGPCDLTLSYGEAMGDRNGKLFNCCFWIAHSVLNVPDSGQDILRSPEVTERFILLVLNLDIEKLMVRQVNTSWSATLIPTVSWNYCSRAIQRSTLDNKLATRFHISHQIFGIHSSKLPIFVLSVWEKHTGSVCQCSLW